MQHAVQYVSPRRCKFDAFHSFLMCHLFLCQPSKRSTSSGNGSGDSILSLSSPQSKATDQKEAQVLEMVQVRNALLDGRQTTETNMAASQVGGSDSTLLYPVSLLSGC